MNSKDMKRIKESLVFGQYYYVKYKLNMANIVKRIIARYCGPLHCSDADFRFQPIHSLNHIHTSKHIYGQGWLYVYLSPQWIEEIEAIDEKDLVKELFINGL